MTDLERIDYLDKTFDLNLQKKAEIKDSNDVRSGNYYAINKHDKVVALAFYKVTTDTVYQHVNEFSALQFFKSTSSKLEDISFLQGLTGLTSLDLRDNQIKSIPKGMSEWKVNLSLVDDAIKIYLGNEKGIFVANNPLEDPPIEIIKQGKEAIRNYFAEREENEEYMAEVKLLIVGEERAGKTSLAKTLTIPGYVLEDEHSTEGIDIHKWVIPNEEITSHLAKASTGKSQSDSMAPSQGYGQEDGSPQNNLAKGESENGELGGRKPSQGRAFSKDLRLNIWDFGGQEIYHATHQFFLTKRSIYLFLTEARKEAKHDDLYYWLNIIGLLGGDSPVIVVLNKCDQPTQDLPISDYQRSFSRIVDYHKISCAKTYESTVDNLRQTIKRVVCGLDHLGTPLPKTWVDIRQRLEDERAAGHAYINHDDFLAICAEYKMDEKRANFLSAYLHDIGVCLHFQDDLELCDTVFLDHEWVTDGVYDVLDAQAIIDRHGQFTDRDLRTIWQDARYKGKRRELLALMKKFELIYPLSPQTYLAPALLPREMPADFQNLIDLENLSGQNQTLRFEFRYDFMPKGILSRLIVKLHPYIYQRTHWRYGVLFEYESTRAFVRERYFDKRLSVTLLGPNKKGLLDIIRKNVGEIHASYHGLKFNEMIPCNCEECRASAEPFFYKYKDLLRFKYEKGKRTKECGKSGDAVNINRLISDVFSTTGREEEALYRLMLDKEMHLKRAKIANADAATGFQLRQQIKEAEAERRKLEDEMD